MLKDRRPRIDRTGIKRLDFPAEIAIETHSYCNLRCIVCPYVTMKRPKGVMSRELMAKILDEVAEVSPQTRLWLAIMGEPMIDANIVDHCRAARDRGLRRVHLNSNGVFLEGDRAEGVLDAGVESIYVAIDAVTSETFDRVRPGGDYPRVRRNVENLLALRDAKGLTRPEIVVQFIIMDENEHEAEAFREFWLDRGAVVKMRLRQGWGTVLDHPDLVAHGGERFPCPWLVRTMNVHWSGKVTQCDADYEELHPAGDLNTQSIREVWRGELARRREMQWNGDFSFPLCEECNDWAAGRAEFFYPSEEARTAAPRHSIGDQRE